MNIEDNNKTVERISKFIDGTISNEDQSALIELMKSDESVRDIYMEMISIDSMLDWEQTNDLETPNLETKPVESSSSASATISTATNSELGLRRRILTLQFSVAGLALLCLVLVSSLFFKGSSPAVASNTVGEGEAIAYLARMSNVNWTSKDSSASAGELLRPGWLKFSTGRVELDFLEGTNVIIEGPAEIGLKGNNRLYLKSGTIIVQSSQESFSIETASQVLDIQEALVGVSAKETHSEFHLFSGVAKFQNELQTADTPNLEVNTAIKFPNASLASPENFEINPGQFPTFEKIKGRENQTAISFLKSKPVAYGYQDAQHDLKSSFSVSADGNELSLEGNSWKMIEINSEITEDTVLEFEFRSDAEGQIHGVGFDTDDKYQTDKQHVLFQIYGFEVRNGIGQQFNSYQGSEWKTFQIRVGRYINGPHKYLYFAADDDVTGKAKSQFRNVKIFEAK